MATNDTARLTNWIEAQLETRGWSIRELARRADISHAAISTVLNGYRNPGKRFCTAMARAFNVPAYEVFKLAGILPEREEPPDDALEAVALYLFRLLDEAGQEAAMNMLRGLVRADELEQELEERRKRREGGEGD